MKEREVTTLWNRGCTDPIRALLYPLYRWKYHICAASLWSNPQNAENGGKFPSSKICNAVISTVSKNRNLINLLYYQNLSRILLFLFMHFVLEASSSCIDLSVLLPWPENQRMPSLFSLLLSFSIIRVMNDSKKLISSISFV